MSREGQAKDEDLLKQLCPWAAPRDHVHAKACVKRKCSRTKGCSENSDSIFIPAFFKCLAYSFSVRVLINLAKSFYEEWRQQYNCGGRSQKGFADISFRKFYFPSKPAANVLSSKYHIV